MMAGGGTPRLIALNEYTLNGTAAKFEAATAALAARVQPEGEPGVLVYLFFADPVSGLGRAVVHYRDAAAWIGHHERSFQWPEMKQLHLAAHLARVSLLGDVTPAILDWLQNAGLTVPLHLFPDQVAGFQRGA